jgi:hypothetical protein
MLLPLLLLLLLLLLPCVAAAGAWPVTAPVLNRLAPDQGPKSTTQDTHHTTHSITGLHTAPVMSD